MREIYRRGLFETLASILWKILNAITEKALASFQYVADQPALISTVIQRSLSIITTLTLYWNQQCAAMWRVVVAAPVRLLSCLTACANTCLGTSWMLPSTWGIVCRIIAFWTGLNVRVFTSMMTVVCLQHKVWLFVTYV